MYAQTSNAEETEVERFYELLQDLLELTPKNDVAEKAESGSGKWIRLQTVPPHANADSDCFPAAGSPQAAAGKGFWKNQNFPQAVPRADGTAKRNPLCSSG